MHSAAHSCPVVSLEAYDGVTIERIKVGTFKRAKGLEFSHVFLPQVALPERSAVAVDSALAERLERERREHFVAITRARDALWLGHRPPG